MPGAAPPMHNDKSSMVGFLVQDASCPQAAFALWACPCEVPLVIRYVFSTKKDLSQYTEQFVALRGIEHEGACGLPLLEARKVDVLPPLPCPCPASP